MKLIRQQIKLLKILCSRPNKNLREAIIKNPNVLKALTEISYNILRGNIKLSPITTAQLQRYKKTLRQLASRKTTCTHKRHLINQCGGGAFLPLILGPVISMLAGSLLK